MIFPDKPRPAWQYAQKPVKSARVIVIDEPKPKTKLPRPPGYWRERIEFGLICVGFYFWVNYWIQFQ